jgi:hypothetical protein
MNNQDKNKRPICHQCGNEFIIQENGISNHIDNENLNYINYDLDLDHVAYEL